VLAFVSVRAPVHATIRHVHCDSLVHQMPAGPSPVSMLGFARTIAGPEVQGLDTRTKISKCTSAHWSAAECPVPHAKEIVAAIAGRVRYVKTLQVFQLQLDTQLKQVERGAAGSESKDAASTQKLKFAAQDVAHRLAEEAALDRQVCNKVHVGSS
jgi:hypothetical protein